MLNLFKKIIGSQSERELNRLKPVVEKVASFEKSLSSLSDDELRAKTDIFKKHINQNSKVLRPNLEELREKLSQASSPDEKDKIRIRIRNLKNKVFEDILNVKFRKKEH